MARYIDADKMQFNCLKDKKFVFAMENPYTQEVIMEIVYKDFLDFLNEQPTADVAKVVHAYWEEKSMDYVCSHCKEHYNDDLLFIHFPYGLPKYCPECGAKMDGKKVE